MAKDDFAVLIGIQFYPGIGNLRGPHNDLKDIYEWLVLPTGGAVPPSNITRLSSKRTKILEKSAPISDEIVIAFQRLVDIADVKSRNGEPYHVGRRLYVYFSGHGKAFSIQETAALMANAGANDSLDAHLIIQLYTNWFYYSATFDEIVLWA